MRLLLKTALVLVLTPFLVVAFACVVLRVVDPPITALQTIRVLQGHGLDRAVVPLQQVSPHLPRSVIASEDNQFCRHHGVDWRAFAGEWRRWREGERPRGASTITMQLTRNLFLWPGRSEVRKALELAFAPVVDLLLPKHRQLALYLNHVEFGRGVFGAEAAARHHFSTSAAGLDRRQAATLIALLPAPLVYGPGDQHVRAHARRIERRVGQLGPLLSCAPNT